MKHSDLCHSLPNRSIAQCQAHYSKLKQSKRSWSRGMDLLLCTKVDELGFEWEEIQKSFPNSDAEECKRHYFFLKKVDENGYTIKHK